MYTIRIVLQCPDEHSEVLPESLESTEHTIEESISLILAELFGTVLVELVDVAYVPSETKHSNILPPVV